MITLVCKNYLSLYIYINTSGVTLKSNTKRNISSFNLLIVIDKIAFLKPLPQTFILLSGLSCRIPISDAIAFGHIRQGRFCLDTRKQHPPAEVSLGHCVDYINTQVCVDVLSGDKDRK